VGQTELSDPCGGAPDFGPTLIRVGGFWLKAGSCGDAGARASLGFGFGFGLGFSAASGAAPGAAGAVPGAAGAPGSPPVSAV
jgi:hypothetical protein